MKPNASQEKGPDVPIGIGGERHRAGLRDTDGRRISPAVLSMAVLAVIVVLAAVALIVF
jgi:hypothetical protein